MKKPILSIIITVFNAQETIDKCLRSVINNTVDVEIIIVDDCSTDDSVNLISKYVNHQNVSLYVKKVNEGVVQARKEGIKHAKGEYIYFVDCDDWIESNALDLMLDQIKKSECDLLLFDAYKHRKDSSVHTICNINILDGIYEHQQIMELYYPKLFGELPNDMASGYLWCCVISKKHWECINYYNNITMHEDEILLMQILPKCSKMLVIHTPIYNYNCTRDNSLSNINIYKGDIWLQVKTIVYVKDALRENNNCLDRSIDYRLARFLFRNWIRVIANESRIDNFKKFSEILKFLRELINDESLEKYESLIVRDHYTWFQWLCIKYRQFGGAIVLFFYMLWKYNRLQKFEEYINNEFKCIK